MAILKHFSVHNRNYHAAVMYLMYEHDGHARPVYDEHGWLIERKNLLIDCINTDLYTYAFDCAYTSRQYGKNWSDRDVKSHHWVISFDPKDVVERGLTVEKAHQLGMEFAQKHFSGFHTIVATHQDGNNGSGNIHVHICHCSVRCKDVPQPRYSELERDRKAGFKFHLTKRCLHYLKEEVMLLCLRNGLHQIELNKHGQRNVSDREYWAEKRGQERLDISAEAESQVTSAADKQPTKFQTELEKLRSAIESASARSTSVEQFQRIMREEYSIIVKESRGRWSYLPEGRERAITWRKLGEKYKKEAIEAVIAENIQLAERQAQEQEQEQQRQQQEQQFVLGTLPTWEEMQSTSMQESSASGKKRTPEKAQQRRQTPPQPGHNVATPQPHPVPEPDEDFFLYGRIIDLNDPKVQASYGLAQWTKIQNLKENARRFAFLSENGLLNVDRLAEETDRTRKEFFQKQTQQKAVENRLQGVNAMLRAMAQFYKTKPIYDEYHAIRNKRKQAKFQVQHEDELSRNEAAVNQIRELRKSMDIDQPTIPGLKKEKAALLEEQERLNTQRKALKDCYQGLSEGYRAIEDQTRQQQRQRTNQHRRDGFSL